MHKIILAAALAAAPLFTGVAWANIAHGNPEGVPPSSTLEIGGQAFPQGDASPFVAGTQTQHGNLLGDPGAVGTEKGNAGAQGNVGQ